MGKKKSEMVIFRPHRFRLILENGFRDAPDTPLKWRAEEEWYMIPYAEAQPEAFPQDGTDEVVVLTTQEFAILRKLFTKLPKPFLINEIDEVAKK
jgi:hypothetical protein